jgi:uncharacterized membrane protein
MTARQCRALLYQQPSQVALLYLQHVSFALQPSELLALLFQQDLLVVLAVFQVLMGLHT